MFRFIITLVLINTSYHSFCSPIATHLISHSLSKSLKGLVDRCENQLYVSQINNYIPECDIDVFNIKQMQCLIFYDISRQLCNSELVLQNYVTNNLKKVIKVNSMCESAKNWKFTYLSDFPQYKAKAEIIFKNQFKCQKICGLSNLTSNDSNIFCKYYQRGTEILKIQSVTLLQLLFTAVENSTDNKIIAAVPKKPVNTAPEASGTLRKTITGVPKVKTVNLKLDNTLFNKLNDPISTTTATLTNIERPKQGHNVEVDHTSSFNTAMSGTEISQKQQKDANYKVNEPRLVEIPNRVQSAVAQKPDDSVNIEIEKVILDKEKQSLKSVDLEKEDQILNYQNKKIKDQGDDPDTKEDRKRDLVDDYGKSFGKDVNQRVEEKVNEYVENFPMKKSYTAEKAPHDDYPTDFIPKTPLDVFLDDYEDEDDDHLFSFLMTLAFIVVLLYLLYNNKSKFTKVILGLIDGGWQTGGRRKSCGHVYRHE